MIEFYAKPHPIFYKYSERRKQRQMKTEFFKGVIKGMSSSKIEEVGEARRSMSAVCGVDCLRFTVYSLQTLTFC